MMNKNAKNDVDAGIELPATSMTSQIDSEGIQHVFVTECRPFTEDMRRPARLRRQNKTRNEQIVGVQETRITAHTMT
jgi:hypothetical protein